MSTFVDASTTLPTQQLFIGGKYVDATSGETFETINPATKKLAAFTEARKALRKSFPQPYFWAPFILIGDPR